MSEFYGISVYFYFRDHNPPHFHVFYGGDEAEIAISDLRILNGKLPPRVYGLVVEWGMLRRIELGRAWDQAVRPEPVDPIEPLP